MDDSLRAAFRAARYRFADRATELILHVDVPSPMLARVLGDRGASSMAVLTAFNPLGKEQDADANLRSHWQLSRDLAAGGFEFLPGRNEDPGGGWPDEESFLVLDIGLPTARALALRYQQLALLWTDAASATPRLVETAAA